MKNIIAAAFLMAVSNVYAGFGGMGNFDEDDVGGSFTFGTLIFVILYFGVIFFFMTRFKNEMTGFMYLMGAVLLLIVGSCVFK